MEYTIKRYTTEKFAAILALYDAVGWTNYTSQPRQLERSLHHSLATWLAFDQSGKIVGIIRTVGDGYSIVYVQDLIVHPSVQRNGIGTALLKTVLREFNHVYQTILITEDSLKTCSFYQSIGLTELRTLNCTAFIRQLTPSACE